jgi:hypothetical protein
MTSLIDRIAWLIVCAFGLAINLLARLFGGRDWNDFD